MDMDWSFIRSGKALGVIPLLVLTFIGLKFGFKAFIYSLSVLVAIGALYLLYWAIKIAIALIRLFAIRKKNEQKNN